MVYFIQAERGGPIKIGWTVGSSAQSRLKALQTGYPYTLRVTREIPEGTRYLERDLHRHFDRWRLQGEWFQSVPELAELANGVVGEDTNDFSEAYCNGFRVGLSEGAKKQEAWDEFYLGHRLAQLVEHEAGACDYLRKWLSGGDPGEDRPPHPALETMDDADILGLHPHNRYGVAADELVAEYGETNPV